MPAGREPDFLKTVFFGTGLYGLPALEALAQSRHRVLAAVTSPDKPRGRSLKTEASPIREAAGRLKIPVFTHDKAEPQKTLEYVRALSPDFLVVVSFGFLLSKELLAAARVAPLNIHPSLLPRHRGASPMPCAILEGDRETGVTVIRMNERMDAGDIAAQRVTPIGSSEDLPALEERLRIMGAQLIVETLDAWEAGRVKLTPQDEARATYTRKFTKEDAKLEFSQPAQVLARRVRALRGWPGTFAQIRGKRILVHRAAAIAGAGIPGTVLAAGPGGIDVAAGEGALSLREIQLEGKKSMSAGDFLRGFPLKAGERFE